MNAGTLHYFALLDPQDQHDTLRRLIASRMSENAIAAATGLSVEQIRRVIAETQTAQSTA